jgi:hypothetical protein
MKRVMMTTKKKESIKKHIKSEETKATEKKKMTKIQGEDGANNKGGCD